MQDKRPPQIRILIVDDHGIVRKGTRALLERIPDFIVVGEAGNGFEAIEQAKLHQPDIILMDLVMPQLDGVSAIQHITQHQPEIRIIALTSFAADDQLFPAIKAGALGYMLKDADPEDLIRSIRQVQRGEPSLHPRIARKVLLELSHPHALPEKPTPDPLTPRELEVLQLVAQGLSYQHMAEQLCIAEVTVRTHVSNILSKLHLANHVQATLYALREGLASLDDD